MEKGANISGNSYCISTSYSSDKSIKYEKLNKLHLSKIHFDDFSALAPVFETLDYLTLEDCSVADGWELHQLKMLDNLTLNNCSFSVNPKINRKSDFNLNSLSLSGISSGGFQALTSVFYSVYHLSISYSHLENIAMFLSFNFVSTLSLDSVSFAEEDMFDSTIEIANTKHRHFQCLDLENMSVPHPGFFLPISKHLEYVGFTKCTVSNLYELNLFPDLYSLTINDTNYIGAGNDRKYHRQPDGRFTFLNFENMKLKGLDFFVPISAGLSIIDLYNCEVETLQGIAAFSDIGKLRLHPDIRIKNLNSPDNQSETFELDQCIIGPRTKTYHWDDIALSPDFNTEFLASVAPYIRKLKLEGYKLINTQHLKHFTRLVELSFEKCSIDLNDYSSIAPQIQRIVLDTTDIKHQEAFKHFTALEHIEASSYNDDLGHIDLTYLLPLRHQLKTVGIAFHLIQNIKEIKHFTSIEELDICVNSLELARDILSVTFLKKLELDIGDIIPDIVEPVTLDLQHLSNLEKISLRADKGVRFKGIGHLRSLKTLDLSFDCDLENLSALTSLEKLTVDGDDVNKLPRLEHLKVLDLTIGEVCGLKSFENFPNLEKLQVRMPKEQRIEFRGLENLKVLVLEHNHFESILSLENLPNLEELDLENCEISTISKLDKLTGLKTLNLGENEIKNIEGLENLKNLERLNLYYNNISDISLLNKLPRLREVNISGNELEKEDVEKQLDKPEIVLWYSRPYVPFRISID